MSRRSRASAKTAWLEQVRFDNARDPARTRPTPEANALWAAIPRDPPTHLYLTARMWVFHGVMTVLTLGLWLVVVALHVKILQGSENIRAGRPMFGGRNRRR